MSNDTMHGALVRLLDAFQRWLHLPDPSPLLAMLATVAANRMSGDPVWLLLVAPPGGGKSELVESLRGLPDVHATATLTEAALLSGTPAKETAKDARGGLLRVIGDRGILLCKDFGSVLSMHRDARASVLAALREVFDGSWVRHVGTDGGRTLAWSGRVGFIGGCPPTIDRHHAVMATLGERFLLLRLEDSSGDERARKALAHAGQEPEMRQDLRAAVGAFFDELRLPPDRVDLAEDEQEEVLRLARVVSRCRSAVERDGYSREIELVPGPESPTRLVVTLKRLLDGLAVIGADPVVRGCIVRRVALDSMPAIRRKALAVLMRLHEADSGGVALALGYPTSTARRTLEDLAAYRVLHRHSDGPGRADRWRIVDPVRRDLTTFPEMSEGSGYAEHDPHHLPVPTFDDFSGKGAEGEGGGLDGTTSFGPQGGQSAGASDG